VEAEMFHADKRTGRLLIVAYRNSAKASKNHCNYVKYNKPSLHH